MTVQVISEGELIREMTQILLQHLTPPKAVRFWASWPMGQGNYLDWRDKVFAQDRVDKLYTEIVIFQQTK